ncbi:MAG: type VI secretion system tip protein TssI/VgrG [Polyangiaceae bacterium]
MLGTLEGWDAFNVVRWHALESISQPYQYEIVVMRDAVLGGVDLDALLDSGATFRIATRDRWRPVHGILAEAEELDRTAQLIAYRFLLVPFTHRARARQRCRSFVDQPLEDILVAVLENRSPAHPSGHHGLRRLQAAPEPPPVDPPFRQFVEPDGAFRLQITEPERLRDAALMPYVVQYNESDFDFLARLLEEAGVSYVFEHGPETTVMTLTDRPSLKPAFPAEERVSLQAISRRGADAEREALESLRDARRARSRSATIRDYDFNRSRSLLEATATTSRDQDIAGHFEFPAADEHHPSAPAAHAATIRMERFEVEKHLRRGFGTVRSLQSGSRIRVEDHDGLRDAEELVVVGVETTAVGVLPEGLALEDDGSPSTGSPRRNSFRSELLAVPGRLRFRPARSTPRPRIAGIQTARVTAEEHADSLDINADSLGRVRLRFPWDQRPPEDGRPSSIFVRVSQYWAGPGFGALYTPRVGHEVLVAYLQGDPDKPVIVGRVYNGQNRPPYDPSTSPTVSTLKSKSSKVAADDFVEGFNELRFTDLKGKEEVFLHAERDLNETVKASHSTGVGGDQSNSVGGNQTNTVHRNRLHSVEGTEDLVIFGDRDANMVSNEKRTVGVNRNTSVGAHETLVVGASRGTVVTATDTLVATTRVTQINGNDVSVVTGNDAVTVGESRTIDVGTDHIVHAGGSYRSTASGNHEFRSTNTYVHPAGDFQVVSTTANFTQSASFIVKAAGCTLSISAGNILLDNGAGAVISMVGGMIVVCGGALLQHVSGGPMELSAGGDMSATAPTIKLNG